VRRNPSDWTNALLEIGVALLRQNNPTGKSLLIFGNLVNPYSENNPLSSPGKSVI
jgi:hypothetical protein